MRRRLGILVVCAMSIVHWTGAAAQTRSYVSGNFILELDGLQVGLVSGVEGGLAFGEVIKEEAGEESFFKKHLGFGGYRDIRFAIGPGMDQSVYEWIGQSLQSKAFPKNGAVLGVDFRGNVVSRLEFTRAQITEVGFPAADGASKDVVHILIGLTPEATSLNKSPGAASSKFSLSKTARAFSGNFKFLIDGVNTTRVSKVDALTIKLPFKSNSQDECLRCGEITAPPPIDFPNIVIQLSKTGAESMESWFQSFVIQGENDDSKEKDGELTFLSPDLQKPLFSLKFKHLGIFELTPAAREANADTIARLVASMYCETMEFSGQ